jgi:uncharacterized protein (TIGR01777 family)
MNRTTWVIAGGAGFLGQAILQKYGNTDLRIIILTRKDRPSGGPAGYKNVSYVHWDASRPGAWMHHLEGSEAVINLVGRSVNCRYTVQNRKEIIDSRVNATRVLGYAIRACERPPKVWVNICSAAIYGDRGDAWMDEGCAPGEGFSPEVCQHWEAAFNERDTAHTRKVLFRLGLVLQKDQGLLKPFARLVRLGLGGKMGTGSQYLSWIHEEDFTGVLASAIATADWEGVINAASPHPVTNEDFMKTLRLAYGVRFGFPNPAAILRLGAWLIRTEAELLLTGRRVAPAVLQKKSFDFRYPRLEDALTGLIRQPKDP